MIDFSAFDYMIEGVQVIDKDSRYVYINAAAALQGKKSKEELVGRTMMEMYPGIENTLVYKRIRKCLKERKPSSMLNEFEFPDGSKGWFELRMQPIEDYVLIMSFDITEQKRAREELEKMNQLLEEKVRERTSELADALSAEKEMNELKSAFVTMASHEFRTPLSTILSSAFILEKYIEPGQQDKHLKHLTRIKSAVKNLVGILNDFLSLDQLERGKVEVRKELFDLPKLLKEVAGEMEGMRKEGQDIRYTHLGRVEVMLDRKIVRNVMLNLLSNAIKYSDQDIELRSEMKHGQVTISVKDKGIGIPENQQKHIFSKFFRASNASFIQGTGLGLNIVKHYVGMLGGGIGFKSRENEGTTFTVTFFDVDPSGSAEGF